MSDLIKTGAVTATGEIINVECGFVPSYVKVYNNNDADSLWPTLEWWSGMADATALKSLTVIDSGTTGFASQAKITTLGITPFQGEVPGAVMVGTIACTAGLKALVGTSTKFLKDLRVNDVITVGGNQYTVAGVTTNTAATVVEAIVKTETVGILNRVSGRSAGFSIGIDTDVNVTTEGLLYIAMK